MPTVQNTLSNIMETLRSNCFYKLTKYHDFSPAFSGTYFEF